MARSRTTRTLTLAAAATMAASGALIPTTPVGAAAPPWTVVAKGLNNPRLLTISPTGIYVAEAGFGGSGPCHTGGDGEKACYGTSGSITRIARGRQGRILTGLPSFAATDGSSAIGANMPKRSGRKMLISFGLDAPPAVRAGLPRRGRFIGTLSVATKRRGSWNHLHVLTDLAAFEQRNDPDHLGKDSDPTGYAKRGKRVVIADSGGNDVLTIQRKNGRIRGLSVFGNRSAPNPFGPGTVPMETVPTATAIGPDGALYVSELTGFPFVPGAARIFRIAPGHPRTVYATGLTNVTDLAWAKGKLYAVQISDVGLLNEPPNSLPSGSLVQVGRGASHRTVKDNLPAPYGVAVRNGSAYVTTCAVCKGGGQVVRFSLP
jgi:hypothetical protein